MRIGFLGLGAIGRPIATHLARTHQLRVWNRTAAKATSFAKESGAEAVAAPGDAAMDAEVVFTCLPNSPEVEQVLGEGLEAGLGADSTLVDLTSGIPETSRRIAGRLSNR
ncbi:MAG TPA: NAD(P)-binding domain-containing protein, partial [Gemmatimonadales bacterium]|nr:NAD(P)-binding domain-containing protein [Gemmatimonadales bacterium]